MTGFGGRNGHPIGSSSIMSLHPGREAALFRPHRGIAAGAAGRRNYRHCPALRRWRVHFLIDPGRRTQHAVGFCQPVAEGFSPSGGRSARRNGALPRHRLGGGAVCGAIGIGRRGLCRRRRGRGGRLCKRHHRHHRQCATGSYREFYHHGKETAWKLRCSLTLRLRGRWSRLKAFQIMRLRLATA